MDLNINFVYAALDKSKGENFEICSKNMFQIFTSFLKIFGKYTLHMHTNNITVEEKSLNIEQDYSLTMIFLSEELLPLEAKFIDLKTELFPVILQVAEMKKYIEVFCNMPTYNLSEFSDTIHEKNFRVDITDFKKESLFNFIYQFSKMWINKIDNNKKIETPKYRVLLGTVHPLLLDYRLQVKMYLERIGYYVEIFYSSSRDIKKRRVEIRESCKKFDAVIHLMNEYYKRYSKDDISPMFEEIFEVFDYIENENPSHFHSFTWIEPQIDESKNLNLNRMLEKIKLISARSLKVHSYQVTIEEFKNLISSRLEYFFDKEDNLGKKKKKYLFIYDNEDQINAKIFFNKIKKELPTLVDYYDAVCDNNYILNDIHNLCTYNIVFLFVDKCDEMWAENVIKTLLKVFGLNDSRTKTKIKIIHRLDYDKINEFVTFGCMSYTLGESDDIPLIINA